VYLQAWSSAQSATPVTREEANTRAAHHSFTSDLALHTQALTYAHSNPCCLSAQGADICTAINNTLKSLLPKCSHRPVATAAASCSHCRSRAGPWQTGSTSTPSTRRAVRHATTSVALQLRRPASPCLRGGRRTRGRGQSGRPPTNSRQRPSPQSRATACTASTVGRG
jgi:hypothetical protein